MPPTDAHVLFRWLWLCFDAGVAYARGDTPLEMESGDAAIVTIVRTDWRLRMEQHQEEPRPPIWLTALQEAHTPEPWGE